MRFVDEEHSLFWVVDGLLTPEECEAHIARIEALPKETAPITTHAGPVMNEEIRNNTRVMYDDPDYASILWGRLRPHVPDVLSEMRAVGLNERLRFYRYEKGQRFAPHYDGAFFRSQWEQSLLTVLVYLNSDFLGGDTRFLERSCPPCQHE